MSYKLSEGSITKSRKNSKLNFIKNILLQQL
jgi:hypothetical protein